MTMFGTMSKLPFHGTREKPLLVVLSMSINYSCLVLYSLRLIVKSWVMDPVLMEEHQAKLKSMLL